MDKDEYMRCVSVTMSKHPALRYGQVLFNVLCEEAPELSERMPKDLDPFYLTRHDPKIAEFFVWLAKES